MQASVNRCTQPIGWYGARPQLKRDPLGGWGRGEIKRPLLAPCVRCMTAPCLAFGLLLLVTGCGYWGRRPIDQPTPLKPHDPVWIWSHDTVHKWHDVVITQDSVSGIPFGTERGCYSRCRRSIPRVQVDSMKRGYRTLPQNVTTFVGAATVAILADAAVCYLVDRNDPQC